MIGRRTVMAGLALCAAAPATAQNERFPFDTVWIAESLGEARFATTSRPSLRIGRDLSAAGSAGCNRYRGAVTIEAGRIVFGPLAATRMACFGAGGENERVFLPALGAATAWRIERRMLILTTPQGPLRFRRR